MQTFQKKAKKIVKNIFVLCVVYWLRLKKGVHDLSIPFLLYSKLL
jgi:hypothetical protein